MGFRLALLEVQETDTSVVHYTREDWGADNTYFGKKTSVPGISTESARIGSETQSSQ